MVALFGFNALGSSAFALPALRIVACDFVVAPRKV
jgi:hypothetical protein|tara:strand:- start:3018 stop:3122 length:105 start_codon:yes stop_codon:yes gene_type:complete